MVVEQKVLALNGNEAVAYVLKQADVDVVAAYPITPQTIIVERFSEYVARGEVNTEFICVESEHSALSACLAASAVGARVFTASASAGLALMHEILYVTSGCRAPVVMVVVNRAFSSPANIHCEHTDSMVERDSCWIQVYVENSQEAYDSTIQAFRIAEHPEIMLPIMVCLDGFTLSHTLENVRVLPDDTVRNFVGKRKFPLVTNHQGKNVPFKLDFKNPITIGSLDLQNYYFEHKRQQEEGMRKALEIVQQINEEYGKISGRQYGDGLLDAYRLEDAEIATVCVGSTAGTVKTVVDDLRAEGVKAGLLRIRTFRPLPFEGIVRTLENVKAVGVMDRNMGFGGHGGAVFREVHHALYDSSNHPIVVNYIYGIGGRDTSPSQIRKIYEELRRILEAGRVETPVRFVDLRE
ncbi:MAG: transketolase C-terminal domain-containing protein [Candidatus Jordarchaeum sp.]|uniref:transketolase C-terminal domain-containing protein n=1 Tax=Candidatus Jordarchaeum sp. TaxID=2823881 RepID=UPI00404B9EC4